MGVRTFWIVILLAAAVVGTARWRHAMPEAKLNAGWDNAQAVVEIVRDPVVVAKPDPSPKLPADHVRNIAPKPLAPIVPDTSGTVEREESPRLVRLKDGSLIVDKYWTIAGGEGTADQPFTLAWDLLLSAQSGVDSAAETTELPARIKYLDGKEVIVTGFTVKSIVNGPSSDFVLNDRQMDNCPLCRARSVFATVQVKLKTPENIERGALHVFTVRGRFKAAPVVDEGARLYGVYSIENGEIVSRAQ